MNYGDKWMRDSCTLRYLIFECIKGTWPAPYAVIVISRFLAAQWLHSVSIHLLHYSNFSAKHVPEIPIVKQNHVKCSKMFSHFWTKTLPSSVLFGIRNDVSFWTGSWCFSNPEERIGTGAIVCKWFDKYGWFIDSIDVTLEMVRRP